MKQYFKHRADSSANTMEFACGEGLGRGKNEESPKSLTNRERNMIFRDVWHIQNTIEQ
jgi:hypothetical protein